MGNSEEEQNAAQKCPSCGCSAIATNYFSGDVYCTECGLILG